MTRSGARGKEEVARGQRQMARERHSGLVSTRLGRRFGKLAAARVGRRGKATALCDVLAAVTRVVMVMRSAGSSCSCGPSGRRKRNRNLCRSCRRSRPSCGAVSNFAIHGMNSCPTHRRRRPNVEGFLAKFMPDARKAGTSCIPSDGNGYEYSQKYCLPCAERRTTRSN